MAICRHYSNSDLFITFTCNVNWPEIQRELKKHRSYKTEDKPDIVTRAYRAKLADMLSFIKSRKPFGRTVAGACFKTPRTPLYPKTIISILFFLNLFDFFLF